MFNWLFLNNKTVCFNLNEVHMMYENKNMNLMYKILFMRIVLSAFGTLLGGILSEAILESCIYL